MCVKIAQMHEKESFYEKLRFDEMSDKQIC